MVKSEYFLSPLPDAPSAISDLVGYAVRWVRMNFRFLFGILIYPAIVYELTWEAVSWLLDQPKLSYLGAGLAVCLVLLMVVTYEFGVRQIALWSLLKGGEQDYAQALRQARHPVVLFLFLPSVAAELLSFFVLFLLSDLWNLTGTTGGDDLFGLPAELFVVVLVIGLLLLTYLPFSVLLLWNSLLACIVGWEKLSLMKAVGRIFHFQLKSSKLFIWALGYFAAISCLIEAPLATAVGLVRALPNIATGFLHGLLECTTIIFAVAATSVIYAFLVGFRAAAAACIYNELRMRLEGADIMENVGALTRD